MGNIKFSNRTKLYGIDPKGRGSIFIESLTSYLIRLAEVHLIKTVDLIAYEVAPILEKDYLLYSSDRGGNRFYDGAHSLNGFGNNSINMINCLKILTGQDNLEDTTLNRYSDIIGTRNLLKKEIAWCPRCLEKGLYYPVIWCIAAYTTCTIHNIPLQENCNNCTKKIPHLHRKSRVGICPYCCEKHFDSTKSYKKPLEKNTYISKDIENFFLYASNLRLNDNALQRNLLGIVENKFNGKIEDFSRYLKIAKTTMWEWCNGKVNPPFNKVVHIAYKLDVSSLELYTQVDFNNLTYKYDKNTNQRKIMNREKKNFSKEKITLFFKEIEENKEVVVSIRDIAREQSCSTKYLYTNFSDYCKRISANNRRIIKNKEKERMNNISLLIKEQFIKETENGQIPTRKKIEQELQMPCIFMNRTIKDYYFELCLNHGSLLGKE
ncbi:TniQ family protein [Peribacillus sp. YIM B13482]|uniref:TniQ family protein n=1 Tax=Peribacillus sp. YIM B13482 TaxID=3366298 RepID=UPI00366C0268